MTRCQFVFQGTGRIIIGRVSQIAKKRGVRMTEISLAWLLTKVTAPVVGATTLRHIEGAAKAVELELTNAEISYLEAPYVPHPPAGVMAQERKRETCVDDRKPENLRRKAS